MYADFPEYFWRNGEYAVYRYDGHSPLINGHAIVIVSYDDNEQYWLCKNSWGTDWADNGNFRIAYGQCYIEYWQISTVTVNQSCYAKLIPNLISSLSTAFGYLWVNGEWAYALGNASATSSITLPVGSTFQVSPGVALSFGSGVSLAANGTLNAVGTSSQRITFDRSGASGTWGGIQLNNSSSSTIGYCNIYHAATPINLWYSNAQRIHHNVISSSGSYGIYSYASSPNLDNNTITGASIAGLNCTQGGTPFLSENPGPGRNLITQNNIGIAAGYNSHPVLGQGSAAGGNNVYGNSSYEMSAGYVSGIIWAENTYWNRPYHPDHPYYDPSDFDVWQAYIDYIPARSSELPPQGRIQDNPYLLDGDVPIISTRLNGTPNSEGLPDEEFRQLLMLELQGKLEEAIVRYTERFKKEISKDWKRYILGRLAECYRKAQRKDFTAFLDNEVRTSLAKDDELYATTLEVENLLFIPGGNYEKAIHNLSALRSDFSENKETHKHALFTLGFAYHSLLNDPAKGRQYFDELKAKYPDDELTLHAMFLLGEGNPANRGTNPSGNAGEKKSLATVGMTDQYALFGNYPNPFNPSTVISYQLPTTGHVSLKVYNMLGQEVGTLVGGIQDAGFKSVAFDASRLPSGVYFYRLQAGAFIQSKKMLVVK